MLLGAAGRIRCPSSRPLQPAKYLFGKVENAQGQRVDETGPIPDLDCVSGHPVYVLLDANVATNPQVQRACTALVRELVSRKLEVLVCNLRVD
jgi:hypothetical protein